MDWDVIVLGAGAAGLFAAIRAAERGRRVLLLEKARKPGVKILMSGGTRCNITHDCDARGIVQAFGSNGKFLHSALAWFSPEDAREFFHAEGVPTKVETTGKVFPVSDRALDVLHAILRRLGRSDATLVLGEPAVALEPTSNGFLVTTPRRVLTSHNVVLTTGGQSYPGCGTTGDGYRFAAACGHSIVPTVPALVPIRVNAPWISELQGVTLPEVALAVHDQANRKLTFRTGSLLFAHFGLTGPAALDVSRVVSRHERPESLIAYIDLLPAHAAAQVEAFLAEESLASGRQLLAGVLARLLPRRVADLVLSRCGQPVHRTAVALSKPDRRQITNMLKQFSVPLAGTLGFEKAEVTAGGVCLNEVDSRTMQSKIRPGLFLAGEVLDLDGWIGGYNFQSAWSTGWLAGQHA